MEINLPTNIVFLDTNRTTKDKDITYSMPILCFMHAVKQAMLDNRIDTMFVNEDNDYRFAKCDECEGNIIE